ncbi:MAG: cytochrome b/b6 domain-containing protein [Sphingomicrobium sp.]
MKSIEEPEPEAPLAVAESAVWDLPTRLVHWALVALIAFSWWSVKNHQTDWHIWSGVAILTLLIFRLLWGLFGSSTARFANFVRGPSVVRDYLRDNSSWRFAGHSPLGALSVVALLAATALQVGLGLISVDEDGLNEGPLAQLVSLDTSEAARDLHEQFFNLLLVLIGLHVAAIVFYRLALGRKLTGAMFSGRAALEPDVEPMRPGRGWLAVVCLLAALAVSRWIIAGAPPLGT